jgi:hypothetical protein
MSPIPVLFVSILLTVSFVFSAKVDEKDSNSMFLIEESQSESESVPPPPGSQLLRSRKTPRERTDSFHKSADQMNKLNTIEVFVDPKRYEFFEHCEKRLNSRDTLVEEWEGFIMDYNDMYPSRSPSPSRSRSLSRSNSLSRSRSFNTNSSKSRLPSFSEEDEDDFELEN